MLQARFLNCLKTIRDTFYPNMWNFPIYDIFIQQKGKVQTFRLAGRPPPSTLFPLLVGHSDLPMRKTLRVVALLTAMIFFQSKKLTVCKVKDEKEEKILYFLMVFNLLKIIHPSKKNLRT